MRQTWRPPRDAIRTPAEPYHRYTTLADVPQPLPVVHDLGTIRAAVNLDVVRDLVRRSGFGAFEDVLAARARPGFVLDPATRAPDAGQLGGRPPLPEGALWPGWRWPGYEAQPMTHVAELDLAELDPTIWPGPRSGALSFFAAVDPGALFIDSGGAALVVHHPADLARE